MTVYAPGTSVEEYLLQNAGQTVRTPQGPVVLPVVITSTPTTTETTRLVAANPSNRECHGILCGACGLFVSTFMLLLLWLYSTATHQQSKP